MHLILPLFLLFVIWLRYEYKKNQDLIDSKASNFWKKEREANSTRKKSIDALDYITFPLDSIPFIESNDEEIIKYQNTLKELSAKRILNLSNLSNTQIKAEYGCANLSILSEYDENYTTLVHVLAKLGERLMNQGYCEQGLTFLELGIEFGTDISSNYICLAKYYQVHNLTDKLSALCSKANQLNSIMKDPIIKKLQSFTIL